MHNRSHSVNTLAALLRRNPTQLLPNFFSSLLDILELWHHIFLCHTDHTRAPFLYASRHLYSEHWPTYPYDLSQPLICVDARSLRVPRAHHNAYITNSLSTPVVRIDCSRTAAEHASTGFPTVGLVSHDEFESSNLLALNFSRTHFSSRASRTRLFRRLTSGTLPSTQAALLPVVARKLIPHWNTLQRDRHLITHDLAFHFLSNRPDLVELSPLLANLTYLGASSFLTSVTMIATIPNYPQYLLSLPPGTFECCHTCVKAALAPIKAYNRLHTGEDFHGIPASSLQYIDFMLGRYDHPWFVDHADMEQRLDYSVLQSSNNFVTYRSRLESYFHAEIRTLGTLFAEKAVTSPKYRKHGARPLCLDAFTAVPSGSAPSAIIPPALSGADEVHLNKRSAYLSMSPAQNISLIQPGRLHSRSKAFQKTEPGKMRNLAPGSVALYDLSATLSHLAEDAFFAALPETPLMVSEPIRARRLDRLRQYSKISYAAARDYKNFNICHSHSDIKLFYNAIAESFRNAGAHDCAAIADKINICLDDVGIEHEGTYYKWEYGLMSGWRHTMLINTTFNIALGRAVSRILEEDFSIRTLARTHTGDDSVEMWSHPMGGPIAQGILDACGKAGAPAKQGFSSSLGGWFEFCRINYYGESSTSASSLRGVGGFVSNDLQHNPLKGGADFAVALVDSLNTIARRCGGAIALRGSDTAALFKRWAVPPLWKDLPHHAVVWDAALLPSPGKPFGIPALFEITPSGASTSELLHLPRPTSLDLEPLRRVLRSKLAANSPLDLSPYVDSYAGDIFPFVTHTEPVSLRPEYAVVVRDYLRERLARTDGPLLSADLVSLGCSLAKLVLHDGQPAASPPNPSLSHIGHQEPLLKKIRGMLPVIQNEQTPFTPHTVDSSSLCHPNHPTDLSPETNYFISSTQSAYDRWSRGEHVDLSRHDLALEAAVNALFAGSRSVATGFLRDHPQFVHNGPLTAYNRMVAVGVDALKVAIGLPPNDLSLSQCPSTAAPSLPFPKEAQMYFTNPIAGEVVARMARSGTLAAACATAVATSLQFV